METIYFIQSNKGGPIKIGRTKCIDSRVESIQNYSPYPLKLLAKIEDSNYSLERSIRTIFQKENTHGEWFKPSKKLLDFIKSINEGRFEPDKLVSKDDSRIIIKSGKEIVNLSDWQKQIVIGTVLGGSTLCKQPKGKNYYLSMRSKDLTWLQYKCQELEGWFNLISQDKQTYRTNSICSSEFTEMHKFLYNGNKRKINREILDPLRDITIAIWFLEAGGKTGRNKKNAYLNTTKFDIDGSEMIRDYFNELDMFCNINQNKERIRLVFTVDGTNALFRVIVPQFPAYIDQE